MKIAVIDGQGGGIGRVITEKLRQGLPDDTVIYALGTNSCATGAMMRAGANEGGSGENAIVQTVARVQVVVGPLSVMVPHAMLGEVTPAIAEAVGRSEARKFLLPLNKSGVEVIGVRSEPLPHLVEELVQKVREWMVNGRV